MQEWTRTMGREPGTPPGEVLGDIAGLLTPADVAERDGVTVSTITSYVARDDAQLPAPHAYVGRTPVWREEDITRWLASRPGKGNRTNHPGRRAQT